MTILRTVAGDLRPIRRPAVLLYRRAAFWILSAAVYTGALALDDWRIPPRPCSSDRHISRLRSDSAEPLGGRWLPSISAFTTRRRPPEGPSPRCESACKPDSVLQPLRRSRRGDHPSGVGVAATPRATYPGLGRRATDVPVWSCSGWGLPSRPVSRDAGELLPHRFTLACATSAPEEPRPEFCPEG